MSLHHFSIRKWLVNRCVHALEKAYKMSKQAQRLQRDSMAYRKDRGASYRRCASDVALYISSALAQASSRIHWSLLEYRIASLLLMWTTGGTSAKSRPDSRTALGLGGLWPHMNASLLLPSKSAAKADGTLAANSRVEPPCDQAGDAPLGSEWDETKRATLAVMHRKHVWIRATLVDLALFKRRWLGLSTRRPVHESDALVWWAHSQLRPRARAYELLSLIPRSIFRSLSRFRSELARDSLSLVLPEFRLVRHQTIASLQYMLCLLFVPWILASLCRSLVLEPLIDGWWDGVQPELFGSMLQEQRALKGLEQMGDLLWLESLLIEEEVLAEHPFNLSVQIAQNTLELIGVYNHAAADAVLRILTDLIYITSLAGLLIWGKKRLAVLNSWIQGLFYSFSDTMKAFVILLLGDLCLGFHSPRGWQLVANLLSQHLGLADNKHMVCCVVSTLPVILDTILKYWIFRHLNHISPSIVATYHTMAE